MIRFLAVGALCSISLLHYGCMTRHFAKRAAGEEAAINIRTLPQEDGTILVNWTETPIGNEGAIYLPPPDSHCEEVNLFADTAPGQKQKLTSEFRSIAPIEYFDKQSRAEKWAELTLTPCDLLVSVGTLIREKFSGLLVTTTRGPVAEVRFPMPADNPSDPALWAPVIIAAPMTDVFLLGLYPFIRDEKMGSLDGIPAKPITVSFDFADGSRKETKLFHEEAEALLENQFPKMVETKGPTFLPEWARVRFWTRAALAKLRLDFREHGFALTSVDGEEGDWLHDLRDGSQPRSALNKRISRSGYIRFKSRSPRSASHPTPNLSGLGQLPQPPYRELTTWDPDDLERFLRTVQEHSGNSDDIRSRLPHTTSEEVQQDPLAELLAENRILAYAVSPEEKGVVQVQPAHNAYPLRDEIDSYLLLQFDSSDRFIGSRYLEITFTECEPGFWKTHRHETSYLAPPCHEQARCFGLARHFASTDQPKQAYRAIEAGFISWQDFLEENPLDEQELYDMGYINKRIETLNEQMVRKGRALTTEYPAIATAAKAEFTRANFEQMAPGYGPGAQELFRKRLDIYAKLFDQEAVAAAENAWAEFYHEGPGRESPDRQESPPPLP